MIKALIMPICVAALVGCTDNSVSPQTNAEATDGTLFSEEQAIQIAKDVNQMEYDRSQPITVELLDDHYIITFPVDKSAPAGTRYRGPDYAARYWIDAKTGEVLQGRRGG